MAFEAFQAVIVWNATEGLYKFLGEPRKPIYTLCSWGNPWIPDLCASPSQMLGLSVCVTILSFM